VKKDVPVTETRTNMAALRREMVETCRRMNSSGINQGTAGNLSVRTATGFLITPSSLPYDVMTPDDLVEMDFDGTYVGRRPSSEWRFHRDILRTARTSTWCSTAIRCTRPRSPATTGRSRASTT